MMNQPQLRSMLSVGPTLAGWKNAAGGRRATVPRVESATAQDGRAIGHWNSTASSATQQWLACSRAPLGIQSLLVGKDAVADGGSCVVVVQPTSGAVPIYQEIL